MRCIILIYMLLLSLMLSGQQAEEALERLMTAFPENKTTYYEAAFYYYASPDARYPADSLKAEFVRRGSMAYARMGEVEFIFDGKNSLLADHDTRRVYLQEVAQERQPAFDIRRFVEMGKELGLKTGAFQPGKGLRGVRLYAPQASGTEMKLAYEPESFLIREFSVKVSLPEGAPSNAYDKTRVEGRYFGYRFSDSPFPYAVERLFRKTGKGLAPLGRYAGYTVLGSL